MTARQAKLFHAPEPAFPEPPPDLTGVAVWEGRALLPVDLFDDPDVSPRGIKLAARMAAVGRSIWMSDREMSREFGMPRSSVVVAVRELSARWVHVDHQHFRGKVRRVLWLRWLLPDPVAGVPASAPGRLNSEARGRLNSEAAPHIRRESASDPARPLPISNSSMSLGKEDNVTLRAGGEEETPVRQPAPVAVAPPPDPDPEPEPAEPEPAEPDPTPEEVAGWEREAASGPPPRRIMARLRLAHWKALRESRDAPQLTPRVEALATPPPAPPPPAPPPRAETDDLIRRACRAAAPPEAVEEAARRLCEKWGDWGSLAGFRARLAEARSGPGVKLALSAYRKACSPTARNPGAVFMSVFAERRAAHPPPRATGAAGSCLPHVPTAPGGNSHPCSPFTLS